MIRKLLLATAAIAVATSTSAIGAPKKAHATAATSAALPASNPLSHPSTLPLQTPDFSKIKDRDRKSVV